MNTQLEKLFIQYDFSKKDCYDFLQIFALLPDYKKVRTVEFFEEIAEQILFLKKSLHTEQEILLGEALENIEIKLGNIGKQRIFSGTKQEIHLLKDMI